MRMARYRSISGMEFLSNFYFSISRFSLAQRQVVAMSGRNAAAAAKAAKKAAIQELYPERHSSDEEVGA